MFENLKNKIKNEFTKQPQGYWADKQAAPQQAVQPQASQYTFRVVGVNYREKNVQKLASPIKKYDMPASKIIEIGYMGRKIYRYFYKDSPVELRPEPTNQYDSNAIMVLIDGVHVGYVPQDETQNVRPFLNGPVYISAEVTGGEYRTVLSEKDEYTYSESVKIVITIRRM
jgi:hypothetical protein